MPKSVDFSFIHFSFVSWLELSCRPGKVAKNNNYLAVIVDKAATKFVKIARRKTKLVFIMGALATGLGLLLVIALARSDESPKGPKVTHKVCM